MQPCPWCILQRLIFVVDRRRRRSSACSGAALPVAPRRRARSALLLAVARARGGALAAARRREVGSCNLTLADRIVGATQLDRLLPDVFEARASCADAAVELLGMPYAYWCGGVRSSSALIALLRDRLRLSA